MTSSTNVPWSISYVSGVVFNILSGFLTYISGSLGSISEYVTASPCGLSTTGHYNSNNSSGGSNSSTCGSVFVSKWIWICTWIVVISLPQVGFTEGMTSPSESVCSETFRSAGQIHVDGEAQSAAGDTDGCHRCNVFIEAPNEDNIVKLNFTRIYGFTSSSLSQATSTASKHPVPPPPPPSHPSSSSSSSQASQQQSQSSASLSSTSSCTPKVDITQVASSGSEHIIETICRQHGNLHAPQVFQSQTHLLKLTFEWPSSSGRQQQRHVGFNLDFTFAKKQGPCEYFEFECADRTCLPDTSLVCNGVGDCSDSSDEFHCPPSASPPANSTASSKLLQVILIVLAVIATMGVIACVISHYRSSARSHQLWRHSGSTSHRESSSEHSQLRPHTPTTTSEVVYFPGTEHEREMALARERAQTLHSLPPGISDLGGDLNLPVSVPISRDGEEGYRVEQQRLIHQHIVGCDHEVERESVHPPPNRTVYDGESPPPYRARRFTHPTGGTTMDSKHAAAVAADRSVSATKMPTQVITGNGGSPVVRCYNGGLSNNNNINNVNLSSSSCLGGAGGAMTHHPSYQYHPPHASYPQTGAAAHNGHLRAPNNHHHSHRRESPTAAAAPPSSSSTGHSRHSSSSSSSSNSARSSLGGPPNYDDIIANKFTTRHSNGSDV